MKRSGPLKSRRSGLRRTERLAPSRKPVKAVNRKRKVSEFARCYGSRARVAWVKAQPCVVDGADCKSRFGDPTENAHIVTGGMGRKADADQIVPLCRFHHAVFHGCGAESFAAEYSLDLPALAARTAARWTSEEGAR